MHETTNKYKFPVYFPKAKQACQPFANMYCLLKCIYFSPDVPLLLKYVCIVDLKLPTPGNEP